MDATYHEGLKRALQGTEQDVSFRRLTRPSERYWYSRLPLARRLAEVVAADAIGAGIEPEGDHEEALADFYAALEAEDVMYQAAFSARYSGGAWLWAVVEGDQSLPLSEGQADVRALHVLTRHEVKALEMHRSATSPLLGRPSLLQVTPMRDGAAIEPQVVDSSRLHYIPGLRAQPDEDTGGDGYDLSVLEVYGQRLVDLHLASSAGARLADRLSMPVLRLGSRSALQGGDARGFLAALRNLRESIKAASLMVLTGDDDVTWSGPSLAGLGETIEMLERQVCAVEGISRTRLFGETPRGIGTGDQTGEAMYADLLARLRRLDYAPALRWLATLLVGPGDHRIRWVDPDHATPEQEATRSKALADRDAVLVAAGIIAPDEARARYEDGVTERLLPQLDDAAYGAMIDPLDEMELPEPDASA